MSTPPDPGARARMPLIDQITAGALDEEYVEVAARRPPSTGRPRPGLLAAVATVGFAVLITVAFQQTRDNEDVVEAGRTTLEERIRTRRDVVARAQDELATLRADNAQDESTLEILEDTSDEAATRLRRLRADAGFSAVSGEGVRFVVDDNPDGRPDHRVYDEDLALLVNGLWEAGATAVAVNGYRVTVLTGFRFSGQAIRLNDHNVTLNPPYTVVALGDTRRLAPDLLDTSTGLQFQSRAADFGFVLERENVERLDLPAAPARLAEELRAARTSAAADQDADPAKEGTP